MTKSNNISSNCIPSNDVGSNVNSIDKLLSIKDLSKTYGSLRALESISLDLKAGEVLGLFGHNGAGKTTLMKLILGIISPSGGHIDFMGHAPDSKAAWNQRKMVGYLPENVSFYEQLNGFEVLNYFAKLKGFNKQQVLELLERVGISHAMKRKVKTYSKGMRQRLGLAQAFLGEPKLLLLDEPTVGLDPIATKEFYATVDQLKSQGCSVILCSHVLPGVEQHIDRAMIISSGRTLALGSLDSLRESAHLPAKIIAKGINGAANSDPQIAQFLGENNDTFLVPEGKKLHLVKRLLSYECLDNISVESASLENLYQYFLQGDSKSKKGNIEVLEKSE
ncbi:MAG: Cu-processing system ATP-binding protein [Flavobacteriales bacterium]|jgi:Cu-processing system ATP-binding protein